MFKICVSKILRNKTSTYVRLFYDNKRTKLGIKVKNSGDTCEIPLGRN